MWANNAMKKPLVLCKLGGVEPRGNHQGGASKLTWPVEVQIWPGAGKAQQGKDGAHLPATREEDSAQRQLWPSLQRSPESHKNQIFLPPLPGYPFKYCSN